MLSRGRQAAGPACVGGVGQLALAPECSCCCVPAVRGSLLFVSLCVSPDLLCPRAQNSRLQGLWAVEQDGKWVRVEWGSFSPPRPPPPHDPLGILRSLS